MVNSLLLFLNQNYRGLLEFITSIVVGVTSTGFSPEAKNQMIFRRCRRIRFDLGMVYHDPQNLEIHNL